MKRTKSTIAIILAVVLCFMSVCPAMGAEPDSEAAVQENDFMESADEAVMQENEVVESDSRDGNATSESADEAETGGNAASETEVAEVGDTVEPIETIHSKDAAYATAGADEEKDKWVSFRAVNDGPTLNSKFYYDDSMMLTDANVLSPDLAKVSIGLASAAYIEDDLNP